MRFFSTQSITFKYSSLQLLLLMLLLGLVGIVYSNKQQQDDFTQAHDSLRLQASEIAAFFDAKLEQHRVHSDMLGDLYQTLSFKQTNDQAWRFSNEHFSNTILAGFVHLPDDTRQVSPVNWQMSEELLFQSRLFQSAGKQSKEPINAWGELYYDNTYHAWLLPYMTLVTGLNGEKSVWGSVMEIDNIIAELKKQFLAAGMELFIYDRSGKLVFHPDYGARLIRQNHTLGHSLNDDRVVRKSLRRFISSDKIDGQLYTFDDWGKSVFAVTQTLATNDWTVVVYSQESAVYQDSQSDSIDMLLMALLAVIFVCFSAIILSRYIVSRRLQGTARLLANAVVGKFDVPKVVRGGDEIDELHRQLGQLFKKFSSRLDAKDKEVELARAELDENKALAQAVSYSDNAVFILDLSFIISFVDTQSLSLLNCEREELLETRFFSHIHHHMAFITEQIINDIRRKESWHGELVLKELHNDRQIWVNTTITPLRNDVGHVTKYVVSMQDISFIKDSQNRIEKLAYTDELTSLANRSFFVAQLEKCIEMKKRGHFEFAVLHFDIDDFKRVNDKLGYDGGDLLLMEMAARLQKQLRGEDVLARLGGDEFAFIVVAASSEQNVLLKVNSILETVATPFNILGQEIKVSTSIGITMSNNDDPNLLLQHADLAMYEAKSKGKNTFHFYTKELNEAVQERMSVEQRLSHALEEDGLELYYQPKVDTKAMRLIGYEALLRWNDPELGFVSPGKFIPIAEQSNLILDIGDWVLEKALQFISELEEPIAVSINLSGKQFEKGNFTSQLAASLNKYQIEPSLLEIEITESHLMADIEDAIRQLEDMKNLGVQISIDDFGTGYSSLAYLKILPVETLKIDRSFIRDIPGDINDVEITGAIIAMAQQLGLNVIAEGAETQEQIDFLTERGCFCVQGFFYSKPLPREEAKQWQCPR